MIGKLAIFIYLVFHTKIGNQIYQLIKFYACSTSIQQIMMERLSCTMQHCLLAWSNYALQNFPKNIIGRNNEINFYINCKEWLPIFIFLKFIFWILLLQILFFISTSSWITHIHFFVTLDSWYWRPLLLKLKVKQSWFVYTTVYHRLKANHIENNSQHCSPTIYNEDKNSLKHSTKWPISNIS